MPSLGMANDGPLEAVAAMPLVRRKPTSSWSRAALNLVGRRASAGSGDGKADPAPEGATAEAMPQTMQRLPWHQELLTAPVVSSLQFHVMQGL